MLVRWKLLSSSVLTVRLLISGSCTWTTKLLWLASSGVSNDQRSVVSDKDISNLLLGGLINVLLIVSKESLSDGLTDGVDLGSVTTTSDSKSHVDLGEVFLSEEKNRLESLNSQCWGINKVKGDTIDSDHTSTGLDKGNGNGVTLAAKGLNILTLSGHY